MMEDNMENNYYENEYNNFRNEPPRKKKRAGKVVGIAAAVVLTLGLVTGGSYLVFDEIRDYLDEYRAQQAWEPDGGKQNQEGQFAGLTLSDQDSEVASTNTGTVVTLDVSDVVKEVKPAVVQVTNEIMYTLNFAGQQTSQSEPASGSGVIISENDSELLIVTNHHVVDAEGQSGFYSVSSAGITVQFIDDTTAVAAVKATDEESDLAVLSVNLEELSAETRAAIRIATIGSSDALEEGEGVIAIGNAMGYGLSVTVGYVSALNREMTVNGFTNTFIQTDAAINPGNSGGGLFNTKGELIGINDAKTVDESVEGMGYAIPISSVGDIITELMNTVPRVPLSEEEKGYLGVSGQDIDESMQKAYNLPAGVWVMYIQEGSAAERAGIHEHDIITAIDGREVDSFEELREEIGYRAAGEQVVLRVNRVVNGKYEAIDITVTLTSYAQDAPEGGTVPEDAYEN